MTANITCSVGLITGYAGGSVAYRQELAGQRDRVRALLPFAVAGGLAGAVLLLVTPPSTFRAVVPYLVLLSAVLLGVQPVLSPRGFPSGTLSDWLPPKITTVSGSPAAIAG